jgi:hypothetical protein
MVILLDRWRIGAKQHIELRAFTLGQFPRPRPVEAQRVETVKHDTPLVEIDPVYELELVGDKTVHWSARLQLLRPVGHNLELATFRKTSYQIATILHMRRRDRPYALLYSSSDGRP